MPGLTNETVYTFELKRFVGTTESTAAESNPVTPTPGICDRTQQVQDGILAELADVSRVRGGDGGEPGRDRSSGP